MFCRWRRLFLRARRGPRPCRVRRIMPALQLERLEERTTPSVLLAAFGFNEGAGTNAADASGNGNTGTLTNAAWTTAGKFGDALAFNGVSALVSVPDTAALHLSTAMTLEAWVNPAAVTSAWRDVIYKGNDNYFLVAT